MIEIDLTRYDTVYATGDIHGMFRPMVDVLLNSCKLKDSLVLVCGDIGMGFYKRGYYTDEFRWMQKCLEPAGITVVMFRGNHDNPEYFCKQEYSEFQHPDFGGLYPNVFLIEDYTILNTVKGNILCIGGAISIDRSMRTEDVSWWKKEKFTMPDELDYIEIAKAGVSIVATHTCPQCCGPLFNDAMGYEKVDPMLMCELQNERLDLLEVFENLRSDSEGNVLDNNPIKLWLYGHFHGHFSSEFGGTSFVGLDMIRKGIDLYEIRMCDETKK